MSNGIKIYCPKHYLLDTYNKLVSLFNKENEKKVMYYQVREIIPSEKHLVMQGKTSEDDCRCEAFENAELFLQSVKVYFNKDNTIMNFHLCMETIMCLIFIFLHFFILLYFITFKQPSSQYLEITVLENTKASSGQNIF